MGGEAENPSVRLGRVVLRTCFTLRRWSRYGGPLGPVCEATLRARRLTGYSRRGVELSKGGVVKQIRKGGFRRFAVVVAVAALGILAVGAQAASAGTLEICKSGANGMAGKTFHYTVSPGGNALGYNITPAGSGFTCTSVIDTGAANTQATVTESDVTTTSEVASIAVIPSSREIPGTKDLALKKVTVSLGTTTFNETQVRYTNQPVGGNNGTLKVCKLTETPAFVGRLFSFQVGPVGWAVGAGSVDARERLVRRPGELVVPHPGHVPDRLARGRARADPGRCRGSVHRHRSRGRTSSTSTPTPVMPR